MNSKFAKFWGVGALALTLLVWGCDNVSDTALVGPKQKSSDVIVTDYYGFKAVRETDPAIGVVTSVIGREGGSLSIGQNTLTVPKNAVTSPTTFVMTKASDAVQVGLTATRVTLNDVGHAGFRQNLTLTLSFADGRVPDGTGGSLKLVWLRPDGSIEVLPSWTNRARTNLSASVDHFSDYGVGWPKDPANDP
jgi:hypothetical protein